jgi:ligand-binding sensor domain-containing protein
MVKFIFIKQSVGIKKPETKANPFGHQRIASFKSEAGPPSPSRSIISHSNRGPVIINEESLNSKRKPTSAIERVLQDHKIEKKIKGEDEVIKIPQEEEEPSWIAEGIIVKIKDKEQSKFFDKKAKIVKVLSDYVAEIQVLDSNAKLDIDQQFLETVIPVFHYRMNNIV